MIDSILLEYKLKKKGISDEDLARAQNWSMSTLRRRIADDGDWSVAEIKILLALDFTTAEILEIFFKD